MIGCLSVKRKQLELPVDVSEEFSSIGSSELPAKWWMSFNDQELERLIEGAIVNNFSIRSTWDRLRQAEQIARKSGANLLPGIEYRGSIERSRSDLSNVVSYATEYSTGLVASYELDLWGRLRSSRQASVIDTEAEYEDVVTAVISLSANIAKNFYRLAEVQKQKMILLEQIETNEKLLKIVVTRFKKGFVGISDVLRQQQVVSSTNGKLNQTNENLVLIQNELSVLIGKTPEQRWDGSIIRLIELPPLPDPGIPSEIIKKRPDVIKVYKEVQSADLRVASAFADRFPAFSISSSINTSSRKASDLFDDWFANLAGNIAGSLFDAGVKKAEYERTRAVLSQKINDYCQIILSAIKEVEDALNREYFQKLYLQDIQDQLYLAQKLYERTLKSYIKGQSDFLRVLDAQVSMQTLAITEISVIRQIIESRIDLCRSLAGGWDLQRPEIKKIDNETK